MLSKLFLTLSLFFIANKLVIAQDTLIIYLDSLYANTDQTVATIKRTAIIKDDHYFISDFYVNGKMISCCEFSSIRPFIADGKSTSYTYSGELYAEGKYKDNKLDGIWYYYNDGEIDTVDYGNIYLLKDTCTLDTSKFDNKLSRYDKLVLSNLNRTLNKNLQIPPRCRELSIANITMCLTINTDGKILCPTFTNSVDSDLRYEILRVLSLYKENSNIQVPLELKVHISYETIKNRNEGRWFVEKCASFQGGDVNTFNKWVASQVVYPKDAQKKGIQGKVIIQFSVNRNGKVCDIKVIRGVHPLLNSEALRVIQISPDWAPAMEEGKPVKQNFVIPIEFSLQ
jgi:TonB family protein